MFKQRFTSNNNILWYFIQKQMEVITFVLRGSVQTQDSFLHCDGSTNLIPDTQRRLSHFCNHTWNLEKTKHLCHENKLRHLTQHGSLEFQTSYTCIYNKTISHLIKFIECVVGKERNCLKLFFLYIDLKMWCCRRTRYWPCLCTFCFEEIVKIRLILLHFPCQYKN